jgi:hypothetical protein
MEIPMATAPTLASTDPTKAMNLALQRALAFPLSRAASLQVPPEKALEWAQQEAAFGTIPIDENGMSAGMRLNLLQPIRALLSDWRQARAEFDSLLQPKLTSLDAVRQAESELADAERRRGEELSGIEKKLESNPDYVQKRELKDTAQIRWKDLQDTHAGRAATMFSYSPWYVVLISCIGIAEWLINYDVLLQFTGVPAIAAGSTVLLGALLAFAAHGYGELLKQWSFRFGESREPAERARDWRFLGLSTSALLIVLAAAGCSRYAAALQILTTQAHHSLLNHVGVSDVSPIRDVLISLLANVAAWIVGVFLSYIAHDDNPEYASATRQWNKAHSAWAAKRKQFEQEIRHVEAKFTKTINDRRTAAKTRAASVETELNMLKQAQAHEQALNMELKQAMRANIATYREAFARVLLGSAGKAQLVTRPTNAPLSPFELTGMELPGAEAMQSLMAA